MVDREGRDRLAYALRRFIAGRISKSEWEKSLPGETQDKALQSVAERIEYEFFAIGEEELEFLVGENALSPKNRKFFVRCITFLYSDVESVTLSGLLYHWESTLPTALMIIMMPILMIFTPLYNGLLVIEKYWPFRNKAELEEASRNPRLLSGRRGPAQ